MVVFTALLAVLLFTSCAPNFVTLPHQERGTTYVKTEPLPESAQFSYQTLTGRTQIFEQFWEETKQYKVFVAETSWETSDEKTSFSLSFTYYQSELPGKRKTIIVLPIFSRKETHELLPLFLVSWLTLWNPYADFNAIFIRSGVENDPFDLDSLAEINSVGEATEWMKESVRRFRKVVTGLRYILDWAEGEEGIDREKIGIVGFSTSAPVAVVTAGVDKRIVSTVSFAGAVSFHKVLAEATEPRIKRIRELLQESGSWENFLELATAIFNPINPLHYAGELDSSKTLYFEAELDEYIPKQVRDQFWEASGRPERVLFYSGHRKSFLALTPLGGWYSADRKIIEFFREKLP